MIISNFYYKLSLAAATHRLISLGWFKSFKHRL